MVTSITSIVSSLRHRPILGPSASVAKRSYSPVQPTAQAACAVTCSVPALSIGNPVAQEYLGMFRHVDQILRFLPLIDFARQMFGKFAM